MKDNYEAPQIVSPDMEAELVFVPPEETSFALKLLYYCVAWIVIIAIACTLMWSVVSQYEKAQPYTTMEEFIVSSRQNMFFLAVSDIYKQIDNKFESAYESASDLAKKFNGTLTYSKLSSEYTEDRPVYIVKHDGENLFKVSLSPNEETGFMKYQDYIVTDIELLRSDILSLDSYKLVFAANMLVNINNTSLGTSLKEFEKIDIFGRSDYYGIIINDFVTEPEIVAVAYRNESSPDAVKSARRFGDYYIFERDGEKMEALTISVPSGSEIKLDDKVVSSFFETKRYTEDETEMTTYTIPTVFMVKNISVTLDGEELNLAEQNGFSLTFKNK